MDLSVIVSLAGTLAAVLVAIAVPLCIESKRRPRFKLKVGDPAFGPDRAFKFLHVRVINEPLGSRWLLRNTAAGCKASLTFEELGSGNRPVEHEPARWAATPEPISAVSVAGSAATIFDPTKLPQSYRFDLSPDETGEELTVAIKHKGDPSAFAFNGKSYEEATTPPLSLPRFELPGDEYRLTVRVTAGGINAERDFRLRNYGDSLDDFKIESFR